MSNRHRRGAAAAVVVAAGLATAMLAGGAAGQDPKPVPTACADYVFKDKAADNERTYVYGDEEYKTGVRGEPEGDITGAFLRYVHERGGGSRLFFDLEIADFDGKLDSYDQYRWHVEGEVDGKARFLDAVMDQRGKFVFYYGRARDNGRAEQLGATTGRMFPGKPGILEIDVPVDQLELAGQTLRRVRAWSLGYPVAARAAVGVPGIAVPGGESIASGGVGAYEDRAPDDGGGGEFKATPCDPTGATPTPTPTPDRPGREQPRPGTRPRQKRPLDVRVTGPRPRARRANQRRMLTLRLVAGEPVSRVRARLIRSGTVVAAGDLARLERAGQLSLRLRRRLRPGTHQLALTARRADGSAASAALILRVR